MLGTRKLLVYAVVLPALAGSAAAKKQKRPGTLKMTATANSVEGTTTSGVKNKPGTAAADPEVLPLGTKIRVYTADNHKLGTFVITDTGPAVKGQHIDIYLPTDAEAKRFGRQEVRVKVLKWGTGAESARERAGTKD